MTNKVIISGQKLNWKKLLALLEHGLHLELSTEAIERIAKCRKYLKGKITDTDHLFYGINTGFGSLCNIKINKEDRLQLQENLVRSHACGTGEEVPTDIIRIMLLLKILNMSKGYSGVRIELVERMLFFYNNDVLPVIYQQGSLGASGDLAPLAHLSLAIIGEGDVIFKGKHMKAIKAHQELGIEPMPLHSKEGLALLNGTQFSTAYGIYVLRTADRLYRQANINAALSIDAFNCSLAPFDHRLHDIRPHEGQIKTASEIRRLLKDSQLSEIENKAVQDPYAFRCVPQVHGATWTAIEHARSVLTTEMNSVTDNPNLFPEDDLILSGGNFHAQPIALVLDYLAIALSELGSISERRVFQLISGQRGLPAFLTAKPGLNSGLMIPQYTAASVASQNKQLCTPASVDSIVSSNGQEDHVSMAANAATKLYSVMKNIKTLLAIEWMTANQAMDFRYGRKSSTEIEKLRQQYRAIVPTLASDRVLHDDIIATIDFIATS